MSWLIEIYANSFYKTPNGNEGSNISQVELSNSNYEGNRCDPLSVASR
jgi:hypothetical protein